MDQGYEERLRERRQIDAFSAKIDAARAQNETLRGHAESPHYGVAATVNGNEITELNLEEKALRLPPERLATEILNCFRAAQADYVKASMRLLRETLGNTEFVQNFSERLEEAYPVPDSDDTLVTGHDSPDDEDDDDDGWNRPILRS